MQYPNHHHALPEAPSCHISILFLKSLKAKENLACQKGQFTVPENSNDEDEQIIDMYYGRDK